MQYTSLREFETLNNVWSVKYRGFPLWYAVRADHMTESVTQNPFTPNIKIRVLTVLSLVLLPISLIIILRSKRIFFIADRFDLKKVPKFQFFNDDTKTFIFIRPEKSSSPIRINHLLALSLEGVRILFRMFAKLKLGHNKDIDYLSQLLPEASKHQGVQKLLCAIGDVQFLSILKILLYRKEVFYTNCVIPDAAKFVCNTNFHEIQHGHLWYGTPGHTDIPTPSASLLILKRGAAQVLSQCNYKGNVVYLEELASTRKSSLDLDVLILSTCDQEMYQTVLASKVISDLKIKASVGVQVHPREPFNWSAFLSVKEIQTKNFQGVIVCGRTTLLDYLPKDIDKLCLWTPYSLGSNSHKNYKIQIFQEWDLSCFEVYFFNNSRELDQLLCD